MLTCTVCSIIIMFGGIARPMTLAQILPNGPEALEQLFLLFVWAVPELFAIAIGAGGCYRAFCARRGKWLPLQLGIFPFLFGAASLVWFYAGPFLRAAWWLKASALLPAMFGLTAIVASFFGKKTT